MSVIIKGMDMPKSCFKCEIYCKEFYESDGSSEIFAKRLKNCPLTALPEKHGRLIDADELKKDWENGFYKKKLMRLLMKPQQF